MIPGAQGRTWPLGVSLLAVVGTTRYYPYRRRCALGVRESCCLGGVDFSKTGFITGVMLFGRSPALLLGGCVFDLSEVDFSAWAEGRKMEHHQDVGFFILGSLERPVKSFVRKCRLDDYLVSLVTLWVQSENSEVFSIVVPRNHLVGLVDPTVNSNSGFIGLSSVGAWVVVRIIVIVLLELVDRNIVLAGSLGTVQLREGGTTLGSGKMRKQQLSSAQLHGKGDKHHSLSNHSELGELEKGQQ
ncbi:hypothetical protein CRG98_006699 [Punica granatum]|uniref:Uncharacterized protein n=1 Tax=Punica granatum TaxID=22663 RepID=A0A2I0KWP9_PUNGR|nr:hypothetical protein CRG98_006699 [Punica granatum]